MQWNLSTVLANPRLLQAFESYLRKENDKLSIRGLIFIEALTQLRHETEPSNIEKGLHRIYNTFMAKGAKLELDNISTRDEIKAEIDHLHWAIVNQSDVERILIDTEKQINSALSEKLKQFFQSTHAEVRYGSETQQPSPDKARVVIVGGGFTGFTVAAVLDPMPLFHVTLIDTKDSFEYTPGIIKRMVSPEESTSMRVRHNSYLRNGKVIIGYAEEILQGARALRVNNDEIVPFDYLVIATGSAYASQLKSTDISTPYRLAGLNQVSSELIKARKILVIGGGLVGCELASEIALKYPKKHVTIVESRSSIICRSDPDQQERAKKYLQDLGIELVLNERITDLSDFNQNKVYLGSSGNVYSGYDKVFIATGTRPNTDLLRNSTVYEPLMDCCLDDWGRIRVRPTLQLDHPRYNHIFAGGDATNVVEEKTGYAATLAGVCIARNICRIIKGKEPLRQGEKGTMPAPDQALHGISSQGGIGKQKLSALKKKFAFLNPTWAALKYFDEQQYLRMVQGEAMASSRVFGRLPRKLSTRKSFSNDRPVMKASVSWPSDETSSISSSSENSFQSLEEILNRHLGLDLSLDPKKADTAV